MRRNLEAKLKHKIAKKMILQEFDALYPKPVASLADLTSEGDEAVDNRQTRAAALVIDSTKNMVYSMSEEVRKQAMCQMGQGSFESGGALREISRA
jgi:hypothetical protein